MFSLTLIILWFILLWPILTWVRGDRCGFRVSVLVIYTTLLGIICFTSGRLSS